MLTVHHLQPTAQPEAAAASLTSAAAAARSGGGWVFGAFEIDLAAQRLLHNGQRVALQPRYFDVLVFLAGSGGRLVSKEELLDAVWGHRHVSDSVLKVAINALRVALNEDAKAPLHLETVQRRGYRFLGVRALAGAAGQAAGPSTAGAAQQAPDAREPALAPGSAAAGAPPVRLGNLPRTPADLVGREVELRQLLGALADHRLVTLHGSAGSGKTRLALLAASSQAAADGVWLLRLDALADATLLLHTVARTLGLGPGADADLNALARALAPLQVLLVLDNAEHLAPAVAALASVLLKQAGGVRMLVTSQVRLHVAGEQVQPLGPLALPAEGDCSAEAAAVQLLWLRARQRHSGLVWDEAAAAHAAPICRMLDGLPLALELAATRVPLLGWAGVHQRLGERMALLTRGERDAPERQRSLRAALAWSCSLLEPPVLQLLQHLSVFAGSFTLEGAAAVAGMGDEAALLDGLDDLLEHALITGTETSPVPRWRLFDSVRNFAALGLGEAGGTEAAQRRLLLHMAAVYDQADCDFAEVFQRQWLRSLQAEDDNLRGALNAGFAVPALRLPTLRLFCSSAQYRARAGWRSELRQDHARIVAWSDPASLAAVDALRTAHDLALGQLGAVAQVLPPADALMHVRRAQPGFSGSADVQCLYTALNLEAALLLRLGAPLAERQRVVARMLAMHADDWSPARKRHGMWQALQLLRQRGDEAAYQEAATSYMVTARALGDEHGAWSAAQLLAQSQAAQGHFDNAIALLEQTASGMRAAGELRRNCTVLAQWALLRLTKGADPDTVALLQEALQALSSEGMLWWLADALAWVPAHRGHWPEAIRLQAWADRLAQQRGEKRGPLFAAARRCWDQLLDQQVGAALWRADWPAGDDLDETSALGLAFATH